MEKPLYGLGSTTVPPVRAIGLTRAEVAVDDVCPGTVEMLVMSDVVQVPDIIVGRVWLDSPEIAYHKAMVSCLSIRLSHGTAEPTIL